LFLYTVYHGIKIKLSHIKIEYTATDTLSMLEFIALSVISVRKPIYFVDQRIILLSIRRWWAGRSRCWDERVVNPRKARQEGSSRFNPRAVAR